MFPFVQYHQGDYKQFSLGNFKERLETAAKKNSFVTQSFPDIRKNYKSLKKLKVLTGPNHWR